MCVAIGIEAGWPGDGNLRKRAELHAVSGGCEEEDNDGVDYVR